MQQCIQQHRTVAVDHHKPVPIGPLGICGIVAQMPPPQDFRDFGHAHRHTRVTRVGLLYGVHGKRTNDVYDITALGIGFVPLRSYFCIHRVTLPPLYSFK